LLALLGAPLLATLASWGPSVLAAQKDPAIFLQRE
jgi:ABC-type lipoprotein release transport system permease subunit